VQADAEQTPRLGVGLDVEGEDAQARGPVGGGEFGVVEDHAAQRDRLSLAVDGQRAAEAPVDEVAHGEADVGLVTGDARALEPPPQRRRVGRHFHLDPDDRPAREGEPAGGAERPGPQRAGPLGVVGLYVEVGDLAAVADEEGAAVLQPAVEVHHRPSTLHAVGRLEDEAAHRRHDRTVEPGC
jgi:hypothetical protein